MRASPNDPKSSSFTSSPSNNIYPVGTMNSSSPKKTMRKMRSQHSDGLMLSFQRKAKARASEANEDAMGATNILLQETELKKDKEIKKEGKMILNKLSTMFKKNFEQ